MHTSVILLPQSLTKAAHRGAIPHLSVLVWSGLLLHRDASSLQLLCVLVSLGYWLDEMRKAYEMFSDLMNGLIPLGVIN